MKRSHRLVALTTYFLENPRTVKNLNYFSEIYNSAKSSISEDLDIVNEVLEPEVIGYIIRNSFATGVASFIPRLPYEHGMALVESLCVKLEELSRIVHGHHLHM